MKIDILCRFCGLKNGEFETPKGETSTDLSYYGFIDTRCDVCTGAHGNYKKMQEEYEQKVPDGDFEAHIKEAGFKKENLDAIINDHVSKRQKGLININK